MAALFFFVALAVLLLGLAAPLLVALGTLLLLTSVVALPFGRVLPLDGAVYIVTLAVLLVLAYWICGFRDPRRRHWSDYGGLLLFLSSFAVLHGLCMQWPDFFPMGERLRDYALISAVVKNPLGPQEPWFSGFPLYYYTGWYRFGHMLHHVVGLEVWQIYHVLVALPLAWLLSATWLVCYKLFAGHLMASCSTAFLVALGSNIRGVIFFFNRETGSWWAPSRVIKGVINEFPAWSFILGDAHPHYLNVAFVPLMILTVFSVLEGRHSAGLKLYGSVVVVVLSGLWLGNANTWEVPLWAGTLVVTGALVLYKQFDLHGSELVRTWWSGLLAHSKITPRILAILIVAGWSAASLVILKEEVIAGSVPIGWVRHPIQRTRVDEAFLHWGGPLTLVGLFLPLRFSTLVTRVLAYTFLAASLLFEDIFAFLLLCLYFQMSQLSVSSKQQFSLSRCVVESLGVCSLGLLLLVELVFLDDAYGGDHERMNTIFKVFMFVWFPFHVWAVWLCSQGCSTISNFLPLHDWFRRGFRAIGAIAVSLTVAVFCACFVRMATADGIRLEPVEVRWQPEGLAKVESTFPGAANAIRALRSESGGLVLEAQAGSYSWCAHVATLAQQQAYLGWANHVGLLTREHSEVARREQVTRSIYQASNCAAAAELLRAEGITHLVLGPLEKQQYATRPEQFACLEIFVQSGAYYIFKGAKS
jgi:uncharacterized membrane protein